MCAVYCKPLERFSFESIATEADFAWFRIKTLSSSLNPSSLTTNVALVANRLLLSSWKVKPKGQSYMANEAAHIKCRVHWLNPEITFNIDGCLLWMLGKYVGVYYISSKNDIKSEIYLQLYLAYLILLLPPHTFIKVKQLHSEFIGCFP